MGHTHKSSPPRPLSSSPCQRLICFLSQWICLWIFHIHGIIQNVALYTWFLSLSIMFLWFSRVIACISPLLPFITEQYSIYGNNHIFFMCIHYLMRSPGVFEEGNKIGKSLPNLLKGKKKKQIYKVRNNKGN